MFISVKIKKRRIFAVFAIITAILFSALKITGTAASDNNGIFVPIIMYHSVRKDESQWGRYVISPLQLEKDIIYLKQQGYTAVFVNDLIRYVNYDEKLPEKPCIITFDDGTYNNLTYVMPLLEKYDFKATISVVGSYTMAASESGEKPNPAYTYLRWEDINSMRKSGKVEFCNHSYDMHNFEVRKGSSQLKGESYDDYRKAFLNDTFKTQNLLYENCGFKPNVYTYPFGSSCENGRRLVKNAGFEASLGVEERPNYINKKDSDCLYDLHRYNRPYGTSSEEFFKKALKH